MCRFSLPPGYTRTKPVAKSKLRTDREEYAKQRCGRTISERLGDAGILRQVQGLAASGSGNSIPEKVSGKGDMFPAYRGCMGKEVVWRSDRFRSSILDRRATVGLAPIDDDGDDRVAGLFARFVGFMAATNDAPLPEC